MFDLQRIPKPDAVPEKKLGSREAFSLLAPAGMALAKVFGEGDAARAYRERYGATSARYAVVPLCKGVTHESAIRAGLVWNGAAVSREAIRQTLQDIHGGVFQPEGVRRVLATAGALPAAAESWPSPHYRSGSAAPAAATPAPAPAPEPAPAPAPAPAPVAEPAPTLAIPADPGSVDPLDSLALAVASRIREPLESFVRATVEHVAPSLAPAAPTAPPIVITTPTASTTVQTEGEHPAFPVLVRELSLGHNAFLAGPAGSGKTTGVERAAAALGLTVVSVSAVIDSFLDVRGYTDAHGQYHGTAVREWAETDGALLLIDEIDRSEPGALLRLNMALANGVAEFADGARIRIPAENRVAATANTWGAPDTDYVGAARLDAASLSRFPARIGWDYDPTLERSIAAQQGADADATERALALRATLRDAGERVVWCTRTIVAIGRRVAAGVSYHDALACSPLATVDAAVRDRILRDARGVA